MIVLAPFAALLLCVTPVDDQPPLRRSAASGRWTEPATWEAMRVPKAGDRVQVRAGHSVTFDGVVDQPIRSIHISGRLTFDPDRDARLTVGLIKIQAGDDPCESGFDCEAHAPELDPAKPRAALEVGTFERPIPAGHSALIRLAMVEGLDPEECPAVVCCGGRMEFHGAPMNRTWVKLGATAKAGDTSISLAEPVTGWRAGDRVIVTATKRQNVPDDAEVPSVREQPETEERIVKAIGDKTLTLDAPLKFAHLARNDAYRGEVANLSRNVVVESADPKGTRGHTMYHRNSAGSIAYAEFRHLGKAGKLGKYSLHFHRVGDTMRGASVMGASIWESGNRWITIHGTNDLVVRDCVGYRSLGHGFFLEDGTEVDNILDRNLAVQACGTARLPGQALAFDHNDGAGFWWANSRNAFTRNVAVECDEYGFRYEAPKSPDFDPVLNVRGSDGTRKRVDIRTLPFLRFEGNEAHAQRRYGVNLGGGIGSGKTGGVGDVGPDSQHPFAVKNLRVWDAHWAFTPSAPGVLVDGLDVGFSAYGLWRPRYDRHAYRRVTFVQTGFPRFNENGTWPGLSAFPSPLQPVDDRPPVSVITRVESGTGRVIVRGVAVDDVAVKSVEVNGRPARPVVPDFSEWEAIIAEFPLGPRYVTAVARDTAGNLEPIPHRREVAAP